MLPEPFSLLFWSQGPVSLSGSTQLPPNWLQMSPWHRSKVLSVPSMAGGCHGCSALLSGCSGTQGGGCLVSAPHWQPQPVAIGGCQGRTVEHCQLCSMHTCICAQVLAQACGSGGCVCKCECAAPCSGPGVPGRVPGMTLCRGCGSF